MLIRTKSVLVIEPSGCRARPLVSTPAHSKLVFWYKFKYPVWLFEIMIHAQTKEGHGVENPASRAASRSFWCGDLLLNALGTCAHTHAHAHAPTCTHTHTRAHTHTHRHIHTYTRMRVKAA